LLVIEEVTIRQTFSEIAHMSGLQIALFESFPAGERDTQNCLALRNLKQFLHQFSSFNTVFRYFDYQKLIPVRNKHDIRNQHTQLHRIAYTLSKYFFH
jgi:hypothetical protein